MKKPIFKIIVKVFNSEEKKEEDILYVDEDYFAADFVVHLDSKPQEDGTYHYEQYSGYARYTLNKIPQEEEESITSTNQVFDKYIRPTSFVQAVLKRKDISKLSGKIIELDTPTSRLLMYLINEPLF